MATEPTDAAGGPGTVPPEEAKAVTPPKAKPAKAAKAKAAKAADGESKVDVEAKASAPKDAADRPVAATRVHVLMVHLLRPAPGANRPRQRLGLGEASIC
jgi:large subunit ribosomal protein L15